MRRPRGRLMLPRFGLLAAAVVLAVEEVREVAEPDQPYLY